MNLKKSSEIIGIKSDRNRPAGPEKRVRFVSLTSPQAIDDYEVIDSILKDEGFSTDFFEYKIKNTQVEKRLIDSRSRNGPRERVELERKVDVNANYKHLRQFAWQVIKDTNNVLLIQISQLKGTCCTLPLIFPAILKAKHNILVTGQSSQTRTLLTAKPDLQFKTIPEPIKQDKVALSYLLERAGRQKSLQSIARTLQDFTGLPAGIKRKMTSLGKGEVIKIMDEEAVNILLIHDLLSRYLPMLKEFEKEMVSRNTPVSALANQFSDLMQGIKTSRLIEVFREYLIDPDTDNEGLNSRSNSELFSHLYRKAQLVDQKRVKTGGYSLSRENMFEIMRSIITLSRSQLDPLLWEQCSWFFKVGELSTVESENIRVVTDIASSVYHKLKLYYAASNQSYIETHLIYNIHRYITGRKVLVGKAKVSQMEMDIIRSVVIPIIYQPAPQNKDQKSVRLLLGLDTEIDTLINPIHTVGKIYGFLMGRRLREGVQTFLRPGLKELISRFGKNFFNVFHEMVVLENSLPISRNLFAQWLEQKDYFKNIFELGYIRNELETAYDHELTPKALMERAVSVFNPTYSASDFSEDYNSAKKALLNFIRTIKEETSVIGAILLSCFESGQYNLKSQAFREKARNSSLYRTLKDTVNQSCVEIRYNLRDLAVNNKVILKVPLEYESILLIENIFPISVENQQLQLHLIAVPVKTPDELDGISVRFSRNIQAALSGNSDRNIRELVRANRILRLYRNYIVDFTKFLSVIVLDRQINATLLKIRQQKDQTPAHIKYFFDRKDKAIIGNIQKVSIGKFIQLDNRRKTDETYYNLTVAQALQAVIFFKSASYKLRECRDTIESILGILHSFSQKMKEDYDSLTYQKQVEKFYQLLNTPVDEMNDGVLNLISILAKKIKKTVYNGKLKNSVIVSLYEQWNKLYPTKEKKIDFFSAFIKPKHPAKENKLLTEMIKSRDILQNIKRRKCLIFFPERHREDQLRFVVEIGSFLQERQFAGTMFVAISGLNTHHIEELSKVFYPGNFFLTEKVNPIKPETDKETK